MQNNVTACHKAQCFFTHTSIVVQRVQEPVSQQFLPCSILYTTKHVCTIPNRSSPGITPASTTAAWAHLRALRDTGNTCHGPPDLGEGSSRAHTCTTCPWNAKRKRQDYRCTCMCGDSSGCPTSSGDKLYVHTFTNVSSTLYGVIAWKRFEGVTVFCYLANVFCHNANERACHVAWREHVRAGIT